MPVLQTLCRRPNVRGVLILMLTAAVAGSAATGDQPGPEGVRGAAAESRTAAKPPVYRDHTNVMVVQDAAGTLSPVTTPAELALRRTHILAGMEQAMGPVPAESQRVPTEMQILWQEDTGRYLRQRISFAAEPGDRVPAWLLVPKPNDRKRAAVLCLHQTTAIGKAEPAGLGGLPNLHYAHELAIRGFVCLVPDYPSFGDYPWDFRTQGSHYASGSMKAIWNNMRAVDLLVSLPDVDGRRIGCIGHSLGGHNALFTAAFDTRIRAVVTSCGFTAFHHYYAGDLQGWTSDRYMPRIRDLYQNDPDQVPFDFYEVLGAVTPRSIFVNAPVGDANFDHTGVRKVIAEVERAFAVSGPVGEKLVARFPDCAHDFPPEVRDESYAWLQRQLEPPR